MEVFTMFKIKMMTKRENGYVTISYADTVEEAKEIVKAAKFYHNPIDIYYMYSERR
jgi:hypothetical protein